MLDDYESSYHDLLKQCEVSGTKIITLRLLAIEVFKCVNKLDPKYLNEMFTTKKCPFDFRDTFILERAKSNTTKYGLKSFRNYGARIWNLLPNNCKSVVSLGDFKNIIKSWNGPSCKCPVCSTFLISLAPFELLYFLFSLKSDTGLLDDMHKTIFMCVYHSIVYMPPWAMYINYRIWCLLRVFT